MATSPNDIPTWRPPAKPVPPPPPPPPPKRERPDGTYSQIDQAALEERRRRRAAKQKPTGEISVLQEIFQEAESEVFADDPEWPYYQQYEIEQMINNIPPTQRSPGVQPPPPPTVRTGPGGQPANPYADGPVTEPLPPQPVPLPSVLPPPPVFDTDDISISTPPRTLPPNAMRHPPLMPPPPGGSAANSRIGVQQTKRALPPDRRSRNRPTRPAPSPGRPQRPTKRGEMEISLMNEIFMEAEGSLENRAGSKPLIGVGYLYDENPPQIGKIVTCIKNENTFRSFAAAMKVTAKHRFWEVKGPIVAGIGTRHWKLGVSSFKEIPK